MTVREQGYNVEAGNGSFEGMIDEGAIWLKSQKAIFLGARLGFFNSERASRRQLEAVNYKIDGPVGDPYGMFDLRYGINGS